MTWHVAFWALLAIAVNSMAQQAAFASDRTFYLYSSPLLCIADTMTQLLHILITSIMFSISPVQATHMAYQKRISKMGDENSTHTPDSRMWPRWLFFIMGTLPAVIKLSSFTGMPWTKALGMMAVSSFLMNELIVLIAHSVHPHPRVTEISENAENHQTGSSRNSLKEPDDGLPDLFSLIKCLILGTAWILHGILLLWAASQPYDRLCSRTVTSSKGFEWFILIWCYPVTSLSVATIILFHVTELLSLKFPAMRQWETLFYHHWWVYWISKFGCVASSFFLSLSRHNSSPPPFFSVLLLILTCMYIIQVYPACMKFVCRFRWVGRALFLVKGDAREDVHNDDAGERPPDAELSIWDDFFWDSGGLDRAALFYLLFFLVNLVTCVLWYAFKYDPSGTVNPEWTDVFG